MSLHQRLGQAEDAWRAAGYPCETFPALAEVLEWARDGETGVLRFLRRPQLRALETYWHLRETLKLSYPSYILALTMGAGKTILVDAIVDTEFALALEYPEGPFVDRGRA